ncbi:hypothetical protein LXL04_014258 [Taraxacum kok-saghyz]
MDISNQIEEHKEPTRLKRRRCMMSVPLPLNLIHVFWRKLNLHPSVDSQVDDEAQMFTQNNPTIIREPVVQIINRGRPSSKKKTFRNSRATQPPNDSYRDGCSNTSESYINQFPYILHLYISNVHDVQADGNCGFRAIAACLGLHEDNWSRIRADLLEELDMHQTEYDDMFGSQLRFEIYNSLKFFRSDIQAPYRNWLTLPETGILVASSTTYFPIWSTPPPMHEQVAIAIGFVNNNHYVRVILREEYLMPPVYLQWNRYRRPQAAAWITPYIDRINSYAHFLNSNQEYNKLEHADHLIYIESRSFENSYIPENPRTLKPLTFSKNRLRGAKNRSNISPVAKKNFRKNDFFFPKTLHMSLYNTYLKRFVKKTKKKSCTYAQKIKKSCTYAKVKKKYRFFGNFFQRIEMIKNVLEGSEVGFLKGITALDPVKRMFLVRRNLKPEDQEVNRLIQNPQIGSLLYLPILKPET